MAYREKRQQGTTKRLYERIERWNDRVPTGAAVSYRKDDGTLVQTKTRSRATLLGNHTPVIWLDGVTGCVMLDRVIAT